MFILSRRSCKVFADLGTSSRLLFRHLSILDKGARPGFVRIDVLPSDYERMLEPTGLPSVNDANNRSLRMLGQVSLVA